MATAISLLPFRASPPPESTLDPKVVGSIPTRPIENPGAMRFPCKTA